MMNLPSNWSLTVLEPNPATALLDLPVAVEQALARPLQAPRLRDLTTSDAHVAIVFTDATRACPDEALVTALLRELEAAGVPDDRVTLLCATGLHRASTAAEKAAKLGRAVVERYRVIDHDARHCERSEAISAIARRLLQREPPPAAREGGQTPFSETEPGSLAVNRLLFECDLIIATGVVEPHQYAGYSGGGKTVVIGCGSEETIGLTHGPLFLDHPGVRLGQIGGNPFQQFVREGARAIGLRFVVNVVLDGDGQPIVVRAGDPIAVQDALVQIARSVYEVPITRQYDVVMAKVDPPKDVNLYQASRAITYVGLSTTPPIRTGGVIILEARCPEGAGLGVGEQRFFQALSQAHDLEQLLNDLRRHGCRAGEQRAFMLAQVLLKQPVIVVGSECPEIVTACRMTAAASWAEAFARARAIVGEQASALYLPHPLHTLPIVASDE